MSAENQERNRVRANFLKRMKQLMEKKDEERIVKEIEEYYSRWSEFGIERTTNAHIHLEQLKMLLLPTQVRLIVISEYACTLAVLLSYGYRSLTVNMRELLLLLLLLLLLYFPKS